MNKDAMFTTALGEPTIYWPANKNAVAACAIMSKMTLHKSDMIVIRAKGYIPRLTNGTEIGKVEITA